MDNTYAALLTQAREDLLLFNEKRNQMLRLILHTQR